MDLRVEEVNYEGMGGKVLLPFKARQALQFGQTEGYSQSPWVV